MEFPWDIIGLGSSPEPRPKTTPNFPWDVIGLGDSLPSPANEGLATPAAAKTAVATPPTNPPAEHSNHPTGLAATAAVKTAAVTPPTTLPTEHSNQPPVPPISWNVGDIAPPTAKPAASKSTMGPAPSQRAETTHLPIRRPSG